MFKRENERESEREMNVIEGFCRMKINLVEEVQIILESMSKCNVTVVGNVCYFIGCGEASKALEYSICSAFANFIHAGQ